jgi:hypothetical protein
MRQWNGNVDVCNSLVKGKTSNEVIRNAERVEKP